MEPLILEYPMAASTPAFSPHTIQRVRAAVPSRPSPQRERDPYLVPESPGSRNGLPIRQLSHLDYRLIQGALSTASSTRTMASLVVLHRQLKG